MDWTTELQQEHIFLRERLTENEHRIEHLEYALNTCDSDLEAEGLRRQLHTVQVQHSLLEELLKCQMNDDALSLETLVLYKSEALKHKTAQLSHGWHSGRPTPGGYWEAENKLACLANVLRRYHAWHAGRPYYAGGGNGRNKSGPSRVISTDPTHVGQTRVHPWYIPAPGNGTSEADSHELPDELSELDAMRQRAYHALDVAGIVEPETHLEIITEPHGQIIVTGYVHSDDDNELVIDTLLALPLVRELLIDIKVVKPETCPACHPHDNNDA